MPTRVTPSDVKQIIEIDDEMLDPMIQIFINAANLLVTNLITDSIVTEELKKEIERWLSAHLIAIRDTRVASEGAGAVSQSYQHSLGLNFNVTMYGQQALILDISGAFAAVQAQLDSGEPAIEGLISMMGTKESEY